MDVVDDIGHPHEILLFETNAMLIGTGEDFDKFWEFLDWDFICFVDLYYDLSGSWAWINEVKCISRVTWLIDSLSFRVKAQRQTSINFLHSLLGKNLKNLDRLHKLLKFAHIRIQILRNKHWILMIW